MFRIVAAAVVAVGVAVCGSASANPLTSQLASPSIRNEMSPLVERVHGCHREIEQGRGGWHYHRGRDCDRYDARPPLPPPPPRYYRDERRDYRDYREHRGPRCFTECNYVGPIKVCKERCR